MRAGIRTERVPWVAWGKLRRASDGSVAVLHPLVDHMTDVAACFESLCVCSGIRRALQKAAQRDLDDVDLARLAALAFLHDIGKVNAGFQSKYWSSADPERNEWPAPCGHGSEGWHLISGGSLAAEKLRVGLPLESMATWGELAVVELLRASISHHGRPVDETLRTSTLIWQAIGAGNALVYDLGRAIAEIGTRVRELFPRAFESTSRGLPAQPAFVHLFGGLVQLADWLGSDTRSEFFPYTERGESRAVTARARASHAVTVLGLDVSCLRQESTSGSLKFSKVFGVDAPRPMQSACGETPLGPIVVLEAETGSGKTEAALWRFLNLFNRGAVDGLYFALPTRVAASQVYERVSQFVARVWPSNAPVVVRALPGYEAADGSEKISLPNYQVLWPDQPDDNEAARRWAAESPKRFLAATIAVGTIDQALLAALKVRHAHLRQALLSRSLLVVDEVHASDAYMTALLEHLLGAHVACGGHALLLSATLGSVARERYLNVGDPTGVNRVSRLEAAARVSYPLLSTRDADSDSVNALEVIGNPREKTVHWQTLDAIDDPNRIALLALDAARQGARVLVIRNTVPAAVATLGALEGLCTTGDLGLLFCLNGVATLHHSRFSAEDRPCLDRAVEQCLGKHRITDGPRIVIGTQTLEQSLDLDADLLITDLCPMDVLLQRLGRLHRHERPSSARPEDRRPAGFELPRAWVLTPSGHDLSPLLGRARHGLGAYRSGMDGLQGVYIDLRVIEATRRLIELHEKRSIPQDNRKLVEHATHPEALAAIETELGLPWEAFGREIDGLLRARSVMGKLQALPYDQPFETLTFPLDERGIATRLGAADRRISFSSPVAGPFGQSVRQLSLRHHQVPVGLPPDELPSDPVPLEGDRGFEFSLGANRYRYDRFGLSRIKAAT